MQVTHDRIKKLAVEITANFANGQPTPTETDMLIASNILLIETLQKK